MLPPFTDEGILPPGIHVATWHEVVERFGGNPHRLELLDGLHRALADLQGAGCRRVYLNGSFVTDKENPGDYDLCWDEDGVDLAGLPELLRSADRRRDAMRRHYLGDIFVAKDRSGLSSWSFLDIFQFDRGRATMKGIVVMDLEGFS